MKILIFGPHAEEYSLARVNRGLALALYDTFKNSGSKHEVIISAAQDQVGKLPGSEEFKIYPGLKNIYCEYEKIKDIDVLIYNNFPKDPNDKFGFAKIDAKIKLAYIAWEEDRFPKHFVDEYNQELDAILVASEHTRTVLKRSGVRKPMILVPNALDPMYFDDAKLDKLIHSKSDYLNTNKKFIFFHNSSGLDRKSPEDLISAYNEEFTKQDDVCLFIKSFPSYNNAFPDLISKYASKPNAPEMIYLEKSDLPEEEILKFYLQSNCYLSPSKAEGFNLPVLEAMKLGVPTITTAWSGQMDFANDTNSYLVDFELVPAKSHLDNPGAFWADINKQDLKDKMRKVYEQSTHEDKMIKNIINNAKKTAENYSWEKSAETLSGILPSLENIDKLRDINLGVISTYNTICGIAEYSSFLYPAIEGNFQSVTFIANKDAAGRVHLDGENIIRLWEYGETDFKDTLLWLDEHKKKHGKYPFEYIHIQYSEGFYTLNALAELLNGLDKRNIPTILTAHAFQVEGVPFDTITPALKTVEQIHVLNNDDAGFLKDLGLKNVIHLPHGNITFPLQSKYRLRNKFGIKENTGPVIANHGFMSENKGIMETLDAIKLLVKKYPNLLYLAVNAVNPRNMTSQNMSDAFNTEVRKAGIESNVIHIDSFLEKEEIILMLATADLSIFAYPEFKQTASGAVRLAMAAGRPIISTNSFQLKDISDFAYTINNNKPTSIKEAVEELLESNDAYNTYTQKLLQARQENSWDNIAIKYIDLLANLLP